VYLRVLKNTLARRAVEGTPFAELAVQMPGAYIHPGEWIYGDEDGVLVSRERLHD
ncbi:hypothetical protein ACQUWX_13310, partial [Ralstonia pseudosolanacearum]